MIPDFPTEKNELAKFWNHYLEIKQKQLLGYWAEIPAFSIHEGQQWQLERSDGSVDVSEFEEISGNFTINLDNVPNLTPDKIREQLDQVANEATGQIAQQIISNIIKATSDTGNIIDAQFKPLSQGHFLKMLESIDLSFDEEGNLIPPALIMHPSLWEAKKEQFKAWENDIEFQAKQDSIIDRKREEWRAREASRKLVD